MASRLPLFVEISISSFDNVLVAVSKPVNKIIKNKEVDFVVTRIPVFKDKPKWMTPYLDSNYKVVYSMNQYYEERLYCYTLWQKK